MKNVLVAAAARARAKAVKSRISYEVFLDLRKGREYSGSGRYVFDVEGTQDVFLDFAGRSVTRGVLNDAEFAPQLREGKLHLPPERLQPRANVLELDFANSYATDGNGVHSYVEGEQQFLYCQSEPYWGNRIFPMFDQPDLKGTLKLVTRSPEDWVVVANGAERPRPEGLFDVAEPFARRLQRMLGTGAGRVTEFERTPLLSTYLFCFVAGPFLSIEAPGPSAVPMRMYFRASLQSYAAAQAPSIFPYAAAAIAFFSRRFAYAYPFGKCDLVFCPEFTVGAMEYPGVITFNDQYLFRESPTPAQVSRRGETIAHEVAHMWFGNLVTMRWWNDLWLNESFADFASYLCTAEARQGFAFRTVDSWEAFALHKAWGYGEDQKSTTHPIAAEVDSTDAASSIFDGITYAKGAAVLKQLFHRLGPQLFFARMAGYFRRYEWGNATLKDFFAELQGEGGSPLLDMRLFEEEWVQAQGLNTVEARWEGGAVELRQGLANEFCRTLRHHKLQLAVYGEQGEVLQAEEVVLRPGETARVELRQPELARGVLPNHGDWAYIKVLLDPRSTAFFLEHLDRLTTGVDRVLVLQALFEQVLDAKLLSRDYTRIALKLLGKALDDELLFGFLLSSTHTAVFHYMPEQELRLHAAEAFDGLAQLLERCSTPEQQKRVLKNMPGFALDGPQLAALQRLLERFLAPDSPMPLDVKWGIALRLHAAELPAAQLQGYVERLTAMDPTELKRRYALRIRAFGADMAQREQLWAQLADPGRSLSYVDLADCLAGFFHRLVPAQRQQPFLDRALNVLERLMAQDTQQNARTFANNLPVRPDWLARAREGFAALAEAPATDGYFRNLLRKEVDELDRRARGIALYAPAEQNGL